MLGGYVEMEPTKMALKQKWKKKKESKKVSTNTRQWEFNYLWSSNSFRIEAKINLS